MQTLYWNTDTRIVSTSLVSRVPAQVLSVRGDETINLIVVNGSPVAPYLPDAGLTAGVVIRPPANLKQGVLNSALTVTRHDTAAAGYTIAFSSDTQLTRDLMHVDPDDATSELPNFGATAAFYLVPAGGGDGIESLPFTWTVAPNYYRPLQPPVAVAVNYPPPSAVNALITPYPIPATSGAATLPAGMIHGYSAGLTGNLTLTLAEGGNYEVGAVVDLAFENVGAHTVSLLPNTNGDTVNGLGVGDGAILIVPANSPTPTIVRLRLDSTQSNWEILAAAAPAPAFALHAVTTNADKLALTGIAAGYTVQITGEAYRIEMFMGGDITQDSNWAVLRNTVNLTVLNDTGASIQINGVVVSGEGTSTNVGWVDPTAITNDTPFFAQISYLSDSYSEYQFNNADSELGTVIALPQPMPPRSIVTMALNPEQI